jgi:hypothetical protein
VIARDGGFASGVHEAGEHKDADAVGGNCQSDPAEDQRKSSPDRKPEAFAGEQGKHEACLQGLDATARTIHADETVPQFDQVAVVPSR